MANLLSLKFWFNLRPDALLPVYQKTFIIFVLVLIIFFLFHRFFIAKRGGLYAFFWRQLSSFSLANAFIGLILLFFNYEFIPFLSARFWLLLWAVFMLVWLIFIAKSLLKIPEKKKKFEEEKEYKKYIP
ncbi:MAG: hypothetical protein PHZ04_04155 [Patescibacteria group bacterium]|nr:hypothetical protein [Patescibacteria group bacterium]MDD5554011.1 hypothetical protein [Patescibacteria group bacterium]